MHCIGHCPRPLGLAAISWTAVAICSEPALTAATASPISTKGASAEEIASSAQELAASLGRLLRDPELCDQLGREATIRAESFSVDAIGGRYVALLNGVCARRKSEKAGLLPTS